ncbi:triose-phosphate isomerase [Gluconobacter frateurii]|uniref:Triosephosphate isomerase n=1 Tax=Gluconobacter frateurii NRIC 0228 TaxID=1307946 RepID=A0ABQ0QEL7_9PROT|nr:triose-phosphate isomerase [Gluconobacter frateurii]GBR15844.1 triosephosphate isomerase [Gluconobacter frateurii NRIC 0228]GLP90415.1 triosephosphate isomerase [Gluconobacter frateurii]
MDVSPKLVIGNWKMNGLRDQTVQLATAVAEGARSLPDDVKLVICPPFTQLERVSDILGKLGPDPKLQLGAQDCHTASSGAHTGEISADMLADVGVKYVLLGHSERRQNFGETDALIRCKVQAAEAAGLVPVVCIGETMAERQDGRAATVLASQIDGSLTDNFNGVLAYEPVWAIGSGVTPSRDELERTLFLLRGLLQSRLKMDDIRVPILYGGSVTPAQAPTILSIGVLGGVLVGSASLEAKSFLRIAEAASLRLSSQPLSGPYRS